MRSPDILHSTLRATTVVTALLSPSLEAHAAKPMSIDQFAALKITTPTKAVSAFTLQRNAEGFVDGIIASTATRPEKDESQLYVSTQDTHGSFSTFTKKTRLPFTVTTIETADNGKTIVAGGINSYGKYDQTRPAIALSKDSGKTLKILPLPKEQQSIVGAVKASTAIDTNTTAVIIEGIDTTTSKPVGDVDIIDAQTGKVSVLPRQLIMVT